VFDRAGNLYVTDIPYGRIFRIDPAGRFDVVAEYDGQPNGMKIHHDGRIFISDYRRGILTLDPATGKVDDFLVTRHSESFKGVNDLYFADNGDLYFTDQGQTGLQDATGRVYRWTPDGRLTLLLDNVPSPNGITLNGAQNMLLVAVTRGNAIWRAPIMADGTLSKVGLFIQMSGGIGPDGIAIDDADSVAVAHAGIGGAWIFSRQGIPLAFVKSGAGEFTTNLAYGGKDRRDLYIVESSTGSILRARVEVPGRKHFSHTE
jgi:gluconolactonase